MVDVLVHEDGPLGGGEGAEEGVGVSGAGGGTSGGELVEGRAEPGLFGGKVGLSADDDFRDGGGVAAHGLFVGDYPGFDEGAEDSADELARGAEFAGGHLDAEGAVGERLRGREGAPLAGAVGAELSDAGLEGFEVARLEEILHAAIVAERI